MATFPFRNRLIAQHKASRYYTGQAKGIVSDLLAPADDARKMAFSSTAGLSDVDLKPWQDLGVSMPPGVSLSYDYASERTQLNSRAALLKLAMMPAALSGSDLVRDLVCFGPVGGDVSQGATVVTAVQENATGRLKLYGQTHNGSNWNSYLIHDFGVPAPYTIGEFYVTAAKSALEGSVSIEVAIPGVGAILLQNLYGSLELLQIGSCEYLVGNTPAFGYPPIHGDSMPMLFISNTVLPFPIWQDQWFELGRVDQRSYTRDYRGTLWPADNSSAAIGNSIPSGAPFAMLAVPDAGAFLAPGLYDRCLATLVRNDDPSIRETVQVMGVDALEGLVVIARMDSSLTWPAGSLLKGLLRDENSARTVADTTFIFPGAVKTDIELASPEIIIKSQRDFDMSGDSWDLTFPNGGRFMVTQVGVWASGDITAAQISLFDVYEAVDVFSAVPTPALVSNKRWFSALGLDTSGGCGSLRLSVTGGTGYAVLFLKGFYA